MEVGAEANRLNLAVKKVRSWLGEALRMFTRRVPVSWPHCTRSRGCPLSPLPGSHCGVTGEDTDSEFFPPATDPRGCTRSEFPLCL